MTTQTIELGTGLKITIPTGDEKTLLGGYTREELKAAFDKVANREDWKEHIYATVLAENLAKTLFAIEFFTATTATARLLGRSGDWALYMVEAPGYYRGPAN